jgi:hypothetical protein
MLPIPFFQDAISTLTKFTLCIVFDFGHFLYFLEVNIICLMCLISETSFISLSPYGCTGVSLNFKVHITFQHV